MREGAPLLAAPVGGSPRASAGWVGLGWLARATARRVELASASHVVASLDTRTGLEL